MEGGRAAAGAEVPAAGAEGGGRCPEPGGALGSVPPRFPFPYRPYPIQERFMAALYGALQAGQVGIFESPTGTVRRGVGTGTGTGRGPAGGRCREPLLDGWCLGRGAGAGRTPSPHKFKAWCPVSERRQPRLWCWCGDYVQRTLHRCRGETGAT